MRTSLLLLLFVSVSVFAADAEPHPDVGSNILLLVLIPAGLVFAVLGLLALKGRGDKRRHGTDWDDEQ